VVGVVAVRRFAIAVLTLVVGACAPVPETPRDVVDAYFRAMGRDPLRTLPLLTPAFHARHGVHVVTNAEAMRAYRQGDTTPVPTEPLAIDRLELGWLMIQVRPAFARRLAALERTLLADETSGDTARISVRLVPQEGAAFEQEFALVRDPSGAWRIDSVEQHGVDAINGFEAFIAHPTDAARRRLEASMRKR
jgi:hypothetical protein